MKVLVVALFSLVAVASTRTVNLEDVVNIEELTVYNYHQKIGGPLAERIRQAEEEANRNPSRIVGGSIARLGQVPYQAGIIVHLGNRQSICGGSLLTSWRVVTAAHCWFDGKNQGHILSVVLGSIRIFNGGTRMLTHDVIMHGSWNHMVTRNNIAMINLPSSVNFSDNIAPIALPSGNELNNQFNGATATASGFGRNRDNLSTSSYLNYVNLTVITNVACRQYSDVFNAVVVASNVCTRDAPRPRSPCQGDDGGPLVVTSNDRRILIGVTSFGSARGCEARSPYVFSRVTSFINWINQRL